MRFDIEVGLKVIALWNGESGSVAAGERPLHERGGSWKPATISQIVMQTKYGSKRFPYGSVIAIFVRFDDSPNERVSIAPDEIRPATPVQPTARR